MRELTDDEIEYLKSGNIVEYKITPEGKIIGIMKLIYTYALLSDIGTSHAESWFYHRYCYATIGEALKAYAVWDGESEPTGRYMAYNGRDPKAIAKYKARQEAELEEKSTFKINLLKSITVNF